MIRKLPLYVMPYAVRAMEAEAALRCVRAADHYRAVHVEAVPWSEQTDHFAEAAE